MINQFCQKLSLKVVLLTCVCILSTAVLAAEEGVIAEAEAALQEVESPAGENEGAIDLDANESTGDVGVVEAAPENFEEQATTLSGEVEALKKASLELNRDLLILEEELLFPANTQIAVFLSVDVGQYFRLDSVKLKVDSKVVASHLYTDRQNHALTRGGIQRLYVGNVKSGEHELTAIFTGMGPDNREYKRGATMTIDKDDDAKMIEIRVYDANSNMQPEFDFKEWQL